jgi:hypothetical protein
MRYKTGREGMRVRSPHYISRAALGLSTLNEYRISARGARIARRDNRGYREYLREEQRREAGCPA